MIYLIHAKPDGSIETREPFHLTGGLEYQGIQILAMKGGRAQRVTRYRMGELGGHLNGDGEKVKEKKRKNLVELQFVGGIFQHLQHAKRTHVRVGAGGKTEDDIKFVGHEESVARDGNIYMVDPSINCFLRMNADILSSVSIWVTYGDPEVGSCYGQMDVGKPDRLWLPAKGQRQFL